MNAADLRSIQAPLEERYREAPEAALITLDTDASEEQLATLLRLTERYCVVYQTLARPPVLAVSRKSATA